MANEQIDLLKLFNQVSKSVKKNQTSLNEADSYNHDHGDHMVQTFEVITQAMKDKKNAEPADQLEYAAQLLRKKADSGSGKLYAEGFKKSAKQVTGKKLDAGNVMTMLQTILGAGEEKSSSPVSGDILGSLLGQLSGSGSAAAASDSPQGLDLSDLLSAGVDFMAARQEGKSDLEALTGALMSGSRMTESPHRAQSSQIVTSTLLKALTSMMKQ